MSTPTVLVVDDEEAARLPIRVRLQHNGYEVIEAKDEHDGWRKYQQNRDRIDLMVTDLLMEDWEAGSRLIKKVTESGTSCRIGVYSAHAKLEDWKEKAAIPEVDFYLPKEAETTALIRQIQSSLADRPLGIAGFEDWELLPLPRPKAAETARRETTWTLAEDPIVTADGQIRAVLRCQIGAVETRDVTTDRGAFHELRALGTRSTGTPGEPALLVSTHRVVLPIAATVLQGSLRNPVWCKAEGSYRMLPRPSPQIEGQHPSYTMSREGFSDQYLPISAVEVSPRTQVIDGFHCAVVSLVPMRHNPRSMTLEILTAGEIVVEGEKGLTVDAPSPRPDRDSPRCRLMLGSQQPSATASRASDISVDSPSVADSEQGKGAPPSAPSEEAGGRYLAVGTAQALEAMEPLLAARGRNLRVERAVLGSDIPVDDQTSPKARRRAIQQYLRKQRNGSLSPLRYVLLVGDHSAIPFFYYTTYLEQIPAVTQNIPILSDLWYADFDRGQPEPAPQFALGRLPFNDPELLRAYCDRHLGDEQRSWRKWMFLAGHGNGYKKELKKQLNEHPGNPYLADHVFRCDAGIEADHTQDLLTFEEDIRACPSLVTYRGHGLRIQWELWGGLSSSHLKKGICRQQAIDSPGSLDGVVSLACCTGSIDHPEEPCISHPDANCGRCDQKPTCGGLQSFGATWLALGGAPWFLASTRKSFTPANDEFHRLMLNILHQEDAEDIGTAHQLALFKLLEGIKPHEQWKTDTAAMSILLGDPAWPIPKPQNPDADDT